MATVSVRRHGADLEIHCVHSPYHTVHLGFVKKENLRVFLLLKRRTCLCFVPYLPVKQQLLEQPHVVDYGIRLHVQLTFSVLTDVKNVLTAATFKKGLRKISINPLIG